MSVDRLFVDIDYVYVVQHKQGGIASVFADEDAAQYWIDQLNEYRRDDYEINAHRLQGGPTEG